MNLAAVLLAQLGAVFGAVRADSTLEPIPFAAVEIVSLARGVAADERGNFVLDGLRVGNWTLRASAPGFRTASVEVGVSATAGRRVDIRLAPEPISITGIAARVAVGGGENAVPGPKPELVTAGEVRSIPSLGETDVFRAVQALPAVAAGSDYSTAFYVRGGSADQNLILLDGVPLFNPFHLGGLFAAVDPDVVASLRVWPGAFPADAGDRLSSVVEIWTRDGGRDRLRGHGALGLVSARVGLDGPLPGGGGSYLVSARRTYLDAFTEMARGVGLIEKVFPYGFTDLHAKVTHDVGRYGRLSLSGYLDDEGFDDAAATGAGDGGALSWGARVGALSYRQVIGRSSIHARIAYSGFLADAVITSRIDGENEPSLIGEGSMTDVIAAVDVSHVAGRHHFTTGVQYDGYDFVYDVEVHDTELRQFVPPLDRDEGLGTVAAYLEDVWVPSEGISARIGLRAMRVPGHEVLWLPRFGASAEAMPGLRISLGAGRSAQAVRTLRNEESFLSSLLAYDLLLGTGAGAAVPTAIDIVLSAEWIVPEGKLRADFYWKRFYDLLMAAVPAQPLNAPVLDPNAKTAAGTAMGVELSASRKVGRWSMAGSYVVGGARRTIDGRTFTPRYHRVHSGELQVVQEVGSAGALMARLSAASGQPYTPVVGYHYALIGRAPTIATGLGGRVLLLGEHNSATLPFYVRLDLSARMEIERRWWNRDVRLYPYVSVINALGSPNVIWAEPQGYFQRPRLDFAPQLPFVPSIGVEWRF